MSIKLVFIISVTLSIQAGRACDDGQDLEGRENWADQFDDISARNPVPSPYYQDYNRPNIPFSADYLRYNGGKIPFQRRPPNPFQYYTHNPYGQEEIQPENRFFTGALGSALLLPLSAFSNRLPLIPNPNFVSLSSTLTSCKSTDGEDGTCVSGLSCSLSGGKNGGSCGLLGLRVCCINVASNCGSTITANNTYWQQPASGVSAPSSCMLTVRLARNIFNQPQPICQVRLDFVTFSIDQPTGTGATAGDCTDTFQVSGSTNTVPKICGENKGQHMYLEVPSSATTSTDLQLIFNFATAVVDPKWNIKIALLPCGASYLAPEGCLQYFTTTSGKITSFNWQDIAIGTNTIQLNNQDYNICFRLIGTQKASEISFKVCSGTKDPANPFGLSTTIKAGAVGTAAVGPTECLLDFLLIPNGSDGTTSADRYCGGNLDPAAGTALATVRTSIKPFRISYKTDATEPEADVSNTGFCLDFSE